MKNKVELTLECGHGITLTKNQVVAKKLGVYCPYCRTLTKWRKVWWEEWHVRCTTCTFSRWYGQDRNAAFNALAKHDALTHDVYMIYDGITMNGRGRAFRLGKVAAPEALKGATRIEKQQSLFPGPAPF